MATVSPGLLELLWHDFDFREERLREIATERLRQVPPPALEDYVVATYFLALRTRQLRDIGHEIAYHATSGIHHPPEGSLLAECTGEAVGVDAWDATGRIGILHMAYPLKMLLNDKGAVTSCDLLHTAAGAILFDVYENLDSRLLRLTLPECVVRGFPGPAHGPLGLREANGFGKNEPAFGTILKPTAGITPDEVGQLVEMAAQSPLLLFIKEDENLYPRLDYSPVAERTRRAVAAIRKVQYRRGGKGLVFAPHITGAPHEIVETVHAVVEAGATAVMFSESFSNGAVRMVREATKDLERPPAIYGHNAGIGVRTRCIWREVIDYLARLDGIDFRQTAPVNPGPPFIRPYRAEWEACEEILTRAIPGIKPVMIARAGGLDQGNIIMNLIDAEQRGLTDKVLLLAGSAINAVKNERGEADPNLGTESMRQVLELHESGDLHGVPIEKHAPMLKRIAREKNLAGLASVLDQRYPGVAAS
ncbi:MAG: RuBisCO large subunit C-terminal-like domain-containing protein [Verrucomicrobia bacterium]|nr:RuBisCO large subunit C-terminal-like domain-containing protein [Verrucomicrobiota bacterium]